MELLFPDTYVKASLIDGVKRLQKKSTKTVRGSTEPFYISKLKYPASNVHGRHLQVSEVYSAGMDVITGELQHP